MFHMLFGWWLLGFGVICTPIGKYVTMMRSTSVLLPTFFGRALKFVQQ